VFYSYSFDFFFKARAAFFATVFFGAFFVEIFLTGPFFTGDGSGLDGLDALLPAFAEQIETQALLRGEFIVVRWEKVTLFHREIRGI
jgi:hypothetical protein